MTRYTQPAPRKFFDLMHQMATDLARTSHTCTDIHEAILNLKRKPGRQSSIPINVQESAFAIWTSDSRNPEVLSMSNHRPRHTHSFAHSRSALESIGIMTSEAYEKALRARTNRLNRSNFTRLNRKRQETN